MEHASTGLTRNDERAAMTRSPTSEPRPVTRWNTPGGASVSPHSRTSSAAMTGVLCDGLSNTVLPPATAAQAMPQGMASGKFHGEITTPTSRGHQYWTFVSPAMTCVLAGLPRTRISAA